MSDALRAELVQVAAVAVAWIEDIDYGIANARQPLWEEGSVTQSERVVFDVIQERLRQDDKWGSRHQNSGTWLAILTEEVGETATETLGSHER